ncbi:hypothetical protein NCM_03894 [Burkholderia pseudomallei]
MGGRAHRRAVARDRLRARLGVRPSALVRRAAARRADDADRGLRGCRARQANLCGATRGQRPVDLGEQLVRRGDRAVRRDPHPSVVRAAICDPDPRDDSRQYAHRRVARRRADDGGADRAARPRRDGARARRDALGSRAGRGAPGGARRHAADAQPDGRRRRREPARDDDGPGTGRTVAAASRPIPDRDHVPDRGGVRARHRRGGAVHLPAALLRRASVSGVAARRAGKTANGG